MITYSIINKSQLEDALRLDAEYYQPEYLKLISKLKNQKWKFLGEISKVAYGTTPSGGVFEKAGIPFIRSQDFSNLLIDTSNLVFCTEEFHKQNKKSAVQSGDILFAAVGATIGEVAIVQDEIKEGNINQNIARVRVISEELNPYFVGFFFVSKLGQLQIKRLITGNAQPYLNSEQIKAFVVPVFADSQQKEIAKYFQEIQTQIKVSNSLYSQAENLLLEELGLKDFKVEDDLSYIVNLFQIKSAHRADAEYFQPKYEKLINRIECKKERLCNLLSSKIKKGIEVGEEQYQEEGKLFIRVSNLSKQGLVERDQKYISEELYQSLRKNFEPKVGEILLTKDATPGIAYVVKEPIEGIIASGILRLKIKEEIESEYLTLVINTIVGQYQVERDTGGSVILHWRPEQIENLLIPILPKPTQQKIVDLIQKSHEARARAKQLLEEAKRKVEEAIERG